MSKSRLLWTLVVANVLFTFASVGAEAFFGWTLPPSLAEYRHMRFSGFSFPNAVHFFLLAATALCVFASWIGLVTYWRFARGLYLASWVIGSAVVLFSGPSVRTSVGATFRMVDALVGGAILGLVYFSDLARRFERGPVAGTAPAGMNLGTDRA